MAMARTWPAKLNNLDLFLGLLSKLTANFRASALARNWPAQFRVFFICM